MSKKNTAADTARTTRAQVDCDSFTDVGRQRQLCPSPTLAPNGNPAVVPIDVIQTQRNDLAGPQTQSGEQQQNGVVPLSIRSVTLALIEDPLHCASRQELRHGGKGPNRDRRHASRQVEGDLSLVSQIAQERSKSGHQQLGAARAQLMGAILQELRDVRGGKFG